MHQLAIVDDDDHIWLSRKKWRAQHSCGHYYAVRGERIEKGRGSKVVQISMAREILFMNKLISAYQLLGKRFVIRFKNGNTLDYRKFNLYIP